MRTYTDRNDWTKRAARRERQRVLGYLRRGKKTVYEITGTWTGYTSSQQRVAHREYNTDTERAEWCKDHYQIRYTDGTGLILNVREITGKDQIQATQDGYGKLISSCVRHDVSAVADLPSD